jgi:hypothetical protein
MTTFTKMAHLLYVPKGVSQLEVFVQELIDIEDILEKLLTSYDLYRTSQQAASQMQERKTHSDKFWHLLERELEVRTEAHYRIQRSTTLLKTVYLNLEALRDAAAVLRPSVVSILAAKDELLAATALPNPNIFRTASSIRASVGLAASLLRECDLIFDQVNTYIWTKEGRVRADLVSGETSGPLFTFHDTEFGIWSYEGGWVPRVAETGHFAVSAGTEHSHVYLSGPVCWEDDIAMPPPSKSVLWQSALTHLSANVPTTGSLTKQEAGNYLILWMIYACEAEVVRLGYASPDLRRPRKDNAAAMFKVCQILLSDLKPEIFNPENGQVITLDELVQKRLAA